MSTALGAFGAMLMSAGPVGWVVVALGALSIGAAASSRGSCERRVEVALTSAGLALVAVLVVALAELLFGSVRAQLIAESEPSMREALWTHAYELSTNGLGVLAMVLMLVSGVGIGLIGSMPDDSASPPRSLGGSRGAIAAAVALVAAFTTAAILADAPIGAGSAWTWGVVAATVAAGGLVASGRKRVDPRRDAALVVLLALLAVGPALLELAQIQTELLPMIQDAPPMYRAMLVAEGMAMPRELLRVPATVVGAGVLAVLGFVAVRQATGGRLVPLSAALAAVTAVLGLLAVGLERRPTIDQLPEFLEPADRPSMPQERRGISWPPDGGERSGQFLQIIGPSDTP